MFGKFGDPVDAGLVPFIPRQAAIPDIQKYGLETFALTLADGICRVPIALTLQSRHYYALRCCGKSAVARWHRRGWRISQA